MAEPKTRPTGASVAEFIANVPNEEMRKDSKKLIALMRKHTKSKAQMWGPSIIGFGTCKIKYADGSQLDWPVMGFSPRKAAISLYLMCSLAKLAKHLEKLGKHKHGKSCIYIKRLSDVDLKVLESMIELTARKTTGA